MPDGPTIGTSGGNEAVTAITVGTSGGNKSVDEMWVGTASGNKQVFDSADITTSDYTSSGVNSLGGNASSNIEFTNGGEVFRTNDSTPRAKINNWITPTGDAPDDYEIRADVVSGAVSSGTTGAWLALTSTRIWTVNRSAASGAGTTTAVLSVSIRNGGGFVFNDLTVTISASTV